MRRGDCTPCRGAGCLADGSARITFDVQNLVFRELSSDKRAELSTAFAEVIASACSVDKPAVVDMRGNNISVTLSDGGSVSAFVLSLGEVSANELASRLYSEDFRDSILNSTAMVLGNGGDAGGRARGVAAVVFKPEHFVPETLTTSTLPPTTTSSTSSSSSGSTTSEVAETEAMSTSVVTSSSAIPLKDTRGEYSSESAGLSSPLLLLASMMAARLVWT